MGANIGTTINSQILRLTSIKGNSLLSLISPSTLAPVILLVGLIIMEKAKKQKVKDIGQMIIGLGILVIILPFGAFGALTGLVIIGFGCAPVYPCIIHSTPSFFAVSRL